jgi:hypothetical protein
MVEDTSIMANPLLGEHCPAVLPAGRPANRDITRMSSG